MSSLPRRSYRTATLQGELVEKGELAIVGAKYYFDTGKVVKLFKVNESNLEAFLSE